MNAVPHPTLRPAAVPLICHDPYFSVWSFTDRLTDDWPRHWTGAFNTMCGMARIDGLTFRYLGKGKSPAMEQKALRVLPTRTIYEFEAAGVGLTLTFTTPAFADDLDLLSRPVSYITWELDSADGKPHTVEIYLDVQADWTVNNLTQKVEWGRHKVLGLEVLRVGSVEQAMLEYAGDNVRIDWGHLYLALPESQNVAGIIAGDHGCRYSFEQTGALPAEDDLRMPRAAQDHCPVLAARFDTVSVGPKASESRHLFVAYDERFAIEYMHRKLPPYWRRNGATANDMLRAAEAEYEGLRERCRVFDDALFGRLSASGGARYAAVCSLAYRQCLAAHKLVADADGTPLYFSKENFSNGCIATVDVTYPSSPFFLLLNPELLRAQLIPVLDYAQSRRWKFPFAPHDLGTYPLANGQVYGGGEETEDDQMPVEECGNMLILLGAHAAVTGETEFSRKYWPLLKRWAEYLKREGLDPGTQLCTDDFAGHLGHNTNLSLKAIVGLAVFARMAGQLGEAADAAEYRAIAETMAAQWQRMAADGDHYRLAFDRPGTWSQKYNLVWDKLLELDLFPPEVARRETEFYKTQQQRYGLPLDNRATYTKVDWLIWTATLAEKEEDFRAVVDTVFTWVNECPTRVPMTDWYDTVSGNWISFQARSVVGGIFIKLLREELFALRGAGAL